ncbi:MAG: hypothetical protein WCH10_05445 [bacterium]
MCITNLKSNEVGLVSGGTEQDLWQTIKEVIVKKYPIFESRETDLCTKVVDGSYGITICIPEKKPANCTYESWGKLNDLPEKVPTCY